ncbi:uncharacterized protein LOC127842218 [Dreissena polymorpha]|nr:uncharacterized protein LOC127842218 [Dreissena polymorpha]
MSGKNGGQSNPKQNVPNPGGTNPQPELMATGLQKDEMKISNQELYHKDQAEQKVPLQNASLQDEEAQQRAQEHNPIERGGDTDHTNMIIDAENGVLNRDSRPDLHGRENDPKPPQGRMPEGRSSHDVNCREHNHPKVAKAGHIGDQWEDFGRGPQPHKKEVMQMQLQRAAEASKQMLYGVYGNFVSILEEYEARTHKTNAGRSKIHLPDQSRKTVEDVQSIVQTQLLLFETQQRACPKEVSASINKELRKKTLHWAAVRHEKKMPINETDKYICQLYEVLAKGKTKHEILEKPREHVSAETIRENVQHIFKGKHDAMEVDQQFKNDDKKKATSPETRRSGLDDAYHFGVLRMADARPELAAILTDDLAEFKKEGIEDMK